MLTTKAFLTGLAAASVSMAAISGIVVKDTIGTIPISGAVVQLEKGGQTATTGSDGRFTLASTSILPRKTEQSLQHNFSVAMQNGSLRLNVAGKSVVEVTTFDLNGKALSSVRRPMDPGTHSITLPYRGEGIYLCKVKVGKNESSLKINSVVGVSLAGAVTSQGSSSYSILAKQASVNSVINDVIAVAKEGYLNYRVKVRNSDTSGIAIRMIVCADTVKDVEGNVYQAVRIGNQVWMAENLRTTKYNDGTPIPLDTSSASWARATTPEYCYPLNTTNADSIKKFGPLYNFYVVNPQNPKKLAPAGWHVPTDAELTILENYLIANRYTWNGTNTGNKIAKSLTARTDWRDTINTQGTIGCDLTKNNTSGFSFLPGGDRHPDGTFGHVPGGYGGLWTSTVRTNDPSHVLYRFLFYDFDYVYHGDSAPKNCALSVRLVRD